MTAPILATPPSDLLQGASLFLDFDGTLVELADRPDSIALRPGLLPLLVALRDVLDGRLAIVSGRSIATLRADFGLGGFLLAGSHGLELAQPGKPSAAPERPPGLDMALRRLDAFAAARPGLLVEDKTLGAALHFRLAPEYEAECLALSSALAGETGLFLQHGKMLFELRPGNGGKGRAVTHLLTTRELAAGRPIFIGDDITDEDGFAAAARHDGAGILVGPARPTAATYRLAGVGAVFDWLSQARDGLEKGR